MKVLHLFLFFGLLLTPVCVDPPKPFTGVLKDAPAILDDAAALQFEVQRCSSQKWTSEVGGAAVKREVRCYVDAQSGGADNAMHATEPFSVRVKDGKQVWIVFQIAVGFRRSGMTLQKGLKALKIPRRLAGFN